MSSITEIPVMILVGIAIACAAAGVFPREAAIFLGVGLMAAIGTRRL